MAPGHPPFAAATSGGRDQRLDIGPFVIGQVARISQVIAVVLRPVLVVHTGGPPRIENQEGLIESKRFEGIKKSPDGHSVTLTLRHGRCTSRKMNRLAVPLRLYSQS
jgi:hypothetical protein